MNIASNPDEYCEVCQIEDHEVCSINIEVKGLLPALLEKWFDERVQYRKLSKKFHEEGDKNQSDYFDRRQYLQKGLD